MRIDRKNRIERIKVLKKYAKEAMEMTRNELENAYIKCMYRRTIFNQIPENYWDDILKGDTGHIY